MTRFIQFVYLLAGLFCTAFLFSGCGPSGLVHIKEGAKGIRSLKIEEEYRINPRAQHESALLPDSGFVIIRQAGQAGYQENDGFLLERYASDLNVRWSVPFRLKERESVLELISDGEYVHVLTIWTDAPATQVDLLLIPVSGDQEVPARFTVQSFECRSGKLVREQEILSLTAWTDFHRTRLLVSPDKKNIAFLQLGTDGRTDISLFDRGMNRLHSLRIERTARALECFLADGGMIFLSCYPENESGIELRMLRINAATGRTDSLSHIFPFEELGSKKAGYESAVLDLAGGERLEITIQYATLQETLGYAAASFDFAAMKALPLMNFPVTKKWTREMVKDKTLSHYHVTQVHRLEGGRRIIMCQYERAGVLRENAKGTMPYGVSVGGIPLVTTSTPEFVPYRSYGHVLVMAFDSLGAQEWSKLLPGSGFKQQGSSFGGTEGAISGLIRDSSLYLFVRDRRDEPGFYGYRINTASGEMHSLKLPLSLEEDAWLIRSRTLLLSGEEMIMFFREAPGRNSLQGKLIRMNLSDLE